MKFTYTNASPHALKKRDVVRVAIVSGDETEVFRDKDGKKTIRLGGGNAASIDRRKWILLVRRIVAAAKSHNAKKIAVEFSELVVPKLKKVPFREIASLAAENFLMADFEFTKFKTKPKKGWNSVDEIIVCGKIDNEVKRGFARGKIVGEAINRCRVLANTPGGDMTPSILAREAAKAARGTRAKVRVLGRKEMERLKMNAVLGVARGSKEEPKFIIMEYPGGKKAEAPIVYAGKGVTFDTGGLNLKPSDGIADMHLDMSGGAAVIHVVSLAARLGVKKNVVGLVPAVENMPSGESYRPGDILKSMSGKTIEVLNTDAEGRVILADALTYAARYKPRLIVDVATLTGAALIALGQHASAIMTKDEKLARLFSRWGEESGDYVWPLPLWDEYEDGVKGNFGDVSNIPASGNTRHAGVINGGMFLYQFVSRARGKTPPWVHIDMAPRMTAAPGEHLAKGAAGAPVRLLLAIAEKF